MFHDNDYSEEIDVDSRFTTASSTMLDHGDDNGSVYSEEIDVDRQYALNAMLSDDDDKNEAADVDVFTPVAVDHTRRSSFRTTPTGNNNEKDTPGGLQRHIHFLMNSLASEISQSSDDVNDDSKSNHTGEEPTASHSDPQEDQQDDQQEDKKKASSTTGTSFLGNWSATAIIINFISVGYILNPAAFAQGGYLLGAICLAFISFQSYITGTYVLEACARAEALAASITHSRHALILQDAGITVEEDPTEEPLVGELEEGNPIMGGAVETAGTPTSTSTPPAAAAAAAGAPQRPILKRYLPTDHSMRIHHRTFELSELCRIFMGRGLRNFFTFTTAGDLYGITWTFAVVFGSSLSEHLSMGMGDLDYHLYILMFMVITVPISCMTFVVQVPLQMCFLAARTIMVFLMLGTLIAAFSSSQSHFGTQLHPANDLTGDDVFDDDIDPTPLANFSKIVTVLQVCVFSTAFQFSVPGLTAETGNKHAMKSIISRSVVYIYATNLVLSVTMAVYFGSSTTSSSNLNWLHYHGGTWDGTGEFTSAWWATAIRSYIVLFAAVDGLAVYPLIAVSLGDILMGAMYEDQVHDTQNKAGWWKRRLCFRLLASVPQGLGALLVKDLGIL